jgi:hypothetical protein
MSTIDTTSPNEENQKFFTEEESTLIKEEQEKAFTSELQ